MGYKINEYSFLVCLKQYKTIIKDFSISDSSNQTDNGYTVIIVDYGEDYKDLPILKSFIIENERMPIILEKVNEILGPEYENLYNLLRIKLLFG